MAAGATSSPGDGCADLERFTSKQARKPKLPYAVA